MKLYPLGHPESYNRPHKRAVPTGEYRAPRQGEWYIGAEGSAAYLAAWNYRTPYCIARLVDTREIRLNQVYPTE